VSCSSRVTEVSRGGADDRRLGVLFVTPYVPSPLRPRPFHLIRHLAELGHRVALIAVARSRAERDAAEELRPFVAPLHVVPVSMLRSIANCVKAIPSTLPFQSVVAFAPEARRLMRSVLDPSTANRPDLVHIEHLRAAPFGDGLTGVPVVFDAVDCISRLFSEAKQQAPTLMGRLAARVDLGRTQRFEAGLTNRYARVLTANEADRRALVALTEGRGGEADIRRIEVLTNGVDGTYFGPGPTRRDPATLIYVGRMSYHGNARAVLWLIEEIMPLIWARNPDVRLEVVGDAPTGAIRRLAAKHAPRIVATGYVPDVRPYLYRATISVNPLVYGVGIQNKLLEAMATATPVVTTPIGCSALQARDGEHVLVAAGPETFAAQVTRLLDDPALRARIGASGREYVERHHAWSAVARSLERVYRDVLERSPPGVAGFRVDKRVD
jgi:glycosyltransferase involved in cell wall biosynthesis